MKFPRAHGSAWAPSQREKCEQVLVMRRYRDCMRGRSTLLTKKEWRACLSLRVQQWPERHRRPLSLCDRLRPHRHRSDGRPGNAFHNGGCGDDVDRGQRVLVFDPLFFSESKPAEPPNDDPAIQASRNCYRIGQRPLGMEAAQVNAESFIGSRRSRSRLPTPNNSSNQKANIPIAVRVVTTGLRAQLSPWSLSHSSRTFSELEVAKQFLALPTPSIIRCNFMRPQR